MEKFSLYNNFGSFCSDSDQAIQFRISRIEPVIEEGEKIVFDFDNVRNVNSSFANALFAGLIQNNKSSLDKIYFENCNEKIQSMIEIALKLGLKRNQEKEVV